MTVIISRCKAKNHGQGLRTTLDVDTDLVDCWAGKIETLRPKGLFNLEQCAIVEVPEDSEKLSFFPSNPSTLSRNMEEQDSCLVNPGSLTN